MILTTEMTKIPGLINKVKIKADAKGNPPSEIELLHTGTWNTPWHGDFIITPDDIQEYVANFKAGVGLVADDPRGPIDYGHDDGGKAAGWINSVQASTDGNSLIGMVEWTPAGDQAIKDGEWAYISSEFNPTGCLPWEDPEEEFNFVGNVITGAALTNIPLFKKLKPIMASRLPDKKKKAAATPGEGDKSKQGATMTLEAIRAKQGELTDEEKAFVIEHKDELTDEERTKFGVVSSDEEAEAKAKADKEAADKAAAEQEEKEKADADAKAAEEAKEAEAAKIEADNKGGVKISADRLAKLEADAKAGREAQQTLAQNEAKAFIAASVRKGQIKSGEADNAVKVLMASSGDNRKNLEAFIEGLPVNENLGKELGDAGAESTGAKDELHAKVVASIKASADKGKNVKYASARKEILSADETLAARVKKEEESK